MTSLFDYTTTINSPHDIDDRYDGSMLPSSSSSSNYISIMDQAMAAFSASMPYDEELEAIVKSDLEHNGEKVRSDIFRYDATIANHQLSQLRHTSTIPENIDLERRVGCSRAVAPVNVKKGVKLTIQQRRFALREKATRTRCSTSASSHSASSAASHASAPISDRSVRLKVSHVPIESALLGGGVKRACSDTCFDMMEALMRVASRPDPKIDVGTVDLSCAFTICDARHPDQPIVHCSNTFCSMTGYSREEIIGRNCRFLQALDGNVEKGDARLYTDSVAVQHLSQKCSQLQECQTSLINYRRDGTPFINLVTVVPITWGESMEPIFLVGFQVDVLAQPRAIVHGPSAIDVDAYSCDSVAISLPSPIDHHSEDAKADFVNSAAEEEDASGQSVMAQELADLISSGSEPTSEWARLLLDNAQDLITVLSLKGTFLYVSPSAERLLGYYPEEMIGKSISEFCHPSDVVPVLRELKDSTNNASIAAAARHWARIDGTVNPPTKGGAGQTGPQVNLIMRMRHKQRGYVWTENVGKLHLEQGKGRKVIISSGRCRPVYNMSWEQALRSFDNKGPAFWSKVSRGGLILSTSGSVGDVLDRSTHSEGVNTSLTGMHIGDLVDGEASKLITSSLLSRSVSGIPHQMTNEKGGPSVTVMTTLVPSSAGRQDPSTVFMHTQRVNLSDLGHLQLNKIYSQSVDVTSTNPTCENALTKSDSVFEELSVQGSSSWVFELQSLKLANKRLREEIQCHQSNTVNSVANRPKMLKSPLSPSKTSLSRSSQSFRRPGLSVTGSHNGSTSGSDASMMSYSGSFSDATSATSIDNHPIYSGFKRSRS